METTRRSLAMILLAAVLASSPASAARPPVVPTLAHEHTHPSGAFTFRTPEEWTVGASTSEAGMLEAGGGGLLVRFLFEQRELGFDSLHGHCMTQRLAGMMQTDPWIKFEYDFLSGGVGNRRFLDSAFVVRYDAPILGHREWRQRNLTVVGGGQSLCVIAYAPAEVWKKSKQARALLDAVVASVTFR